MRVLHLLRPWSERHVIGGAGAPLPDATVLACRVMIADQAELEHSVCVLGSSVDEARVRSLGLRTTDRIRLPLGLPWMATPSLRRFFATRALFDEVKCWDSRLVPIARECAPMSRVIDASEIDDRCAPAVPRDVKAVRAARRAALGIGDDELLACLLADPPTRGDAVRMMFMAGTLYEAGMHPHLLLPRGSDRLTRACRFHKAARLPGRLFITGEPAWAWLPACDMAVMVREEERVSPSERLMVKCAHAMGVPVVGPRDDSTVSLYPPEASECISPTNHAASLARSFVHVIESVSRGKYSGSLLARAAWAASGPHETRVGVSA